MVKVGIFEFDQYRYILIFNAGNFQHFPFFLTNKKNQAHLSFLVTFLSYVFSHIKYYKAISILWFKMLYRGTNAGSKFLSAKSNLVAKYHA